MSGLTIAGFQKKTFNDIKLDIENDLQDRFGLINLNEESVFSQLTGVFAEREAEIWLAVEAVYNSFYPDTATDFSLDGVCSLLGITRLIATATTVNCELVGTNQTIILKDSEAIALGIPTIFKLTEQVIINNESCNDINIDIMDITIISYIIIINTISFTYITGISDTKDQIINNLVDLINTDDVTATATNINSILNITSDDSNKISVFISSGMTILNITTTGIFKSDTTGAIALPAKALTIIQTPISGWISIINQNAGLIGRNVETDIELRIRRAASLRLAGSGTTEAIRARLLNVLGVTAVNIVENNEAITVDSRPPHSFEALVLGGADEDIGQSIWKSKPAGIKSVGNTTVEVLDITGKVHVINFSRPVSLYIYVRVTITKDDSNTYPANGDDLVKSGIVNQIKKLNVGDDVIYQSFYQSIFSISGIESAVIEIGGTLVELTVPTLTSANVVVATSQIAVTDLTKVGIIIA